MIHELIHAATFDAVWNPTQEQEPIVAAINRLAIEFYEAAEQQSDKLTLTEKFRIGLVANPSNREAKSRLSKEQVAEFLTYSLTSPDFQSALIHLQRNETKRSFLSELGKLIRRLLRLPPVKQSFLTEAIFLSSQFIEKNVSNVSRSTDISQKEIDAFAKRLVDGENLSNLKTARAALTSKPIDYASPDAKKADEAMEAASVIAARMTINNLRNAGESERKIFDAIADLQSRVPHFKVRTSASQNNQAYSTPMTIAFVASNLAGITGETSLLEPTAGNGALTISANPENVWANELDANRVRSLKRLGIKKVTESNALEVSFKTGTQYDRVILNPPFGADYKNTAYGLSSTNDPVRTQQRDHAIAFRALEAMSDNGKRF